MDKYFVAVSGTAVDSFYNIDSFIGRGDMCEAHPDGDRVGGSILNAAAVMAGHGVKVRELDFLKNDDVYSDMITDAMEKYGIDTQYVFKESCYSAGHCLIMKSSGDRSIYVIEGKKKVITSDDRDIQSFLNNAYGIYMSLTSSKRLFGENLDVLKKAKQQGTLICFDGASQYNSNDDREALKLADLVFLNSLVYERMCDYLGCEGTEFLFENGAKAVCITNGGKGAKCVTPDGEWNCESVKIDDIIDSTGAGDAFAGTFLSTFLKGCSYENCLRMACRGGAYACTKEGGFGGVCSDRELAEFCKKHRYGI